jgi:peptidyl-prolyl cis-trans isomerase A (cyclophilin A)
VILIAALAFLGCENSKADEGAKSDKTQPNKVQKAEQTAKAGGEDLKIAPGKELVALFETSMGTIKVKLFADKAPKTVKNFAELARGQKEWVDPKTLQKVNRPLYDGTIFHRVIPKFMIQGGDPKGNGTGGPGYRFEDEFDPSLTFDRPGLLAMANSGPNTNGSQFFITEAPTPWLSNKHTIFGEVIEGMDIVNNIARVPRNNRDKPNEDVVLKKVTVLEQDAAK